MAHMHRTQIHLSLGVFTLAENGNRFEYRANDTGFQELEFPFLVAVGPLGEDFRFARILKTRAYLAVDEDAAGNPVVERWIIRDHRQYAGRG